MQVNQLWYKGRRLTEHGEADEHLQREEKRAFVTWVQDAREHQAGSDDGVPAKVDGFYLLIEKVFKLVALVDEEALSGEGSGHFDVGEGQRCQLGIELPEAAS